MPARRSGRRPTAAAGTARSMAARSSGVSVERRARRAPRRAARAVRAPTSGTMSSPRESTQAIASWATVRPRASATSRSASTRREVALEVLAREARARGARKSARARARATVAADQAAGQHAVGGDADAELAAGRQDLVLDAAARSASTRSAGPRSGGRRGRGGWCRRPPPRGRCGARSRPATSSAIAPTVSSIGTAGSSRAGR